MNEPGPPDYIYAVIRLLIRCIDVEESQNQKDRLIIAASNAVLLAFPPL